MTLLLRAELSLGLVDPLIGLGWVWSTVPKPKYSIIYGNYVRQSRINQTYSLQHACWLAVTLLSVVVYELFGDSRASSF